MLEAIEPLALQHADGLQGIEIKLDMGMIGKGNEIGLAKGSLVLLSGEDGRVPLSERRKFWRLHRNQFGKQPGVG